MFNKLKQFNDLRKQAKALQAKLADIVQEAENNGVYMKLNGNLKLLEINIDPFLLSEDNKQRLEELITKTHNDIIVKIQRSIAMSMKDMGGFDGMPGAQQ